MREAARALEIESVLADGVSRRLKETGCTKRSAVRLAIIEAIYSGALKPGDDLPAERRLAEVLGVSLGTVQAALTQLQNAGRITRRRGDGSRVAAHDAPFENVWHLRMLDRDTGLPMRWGKAQVEIGQVSAQGPWAAFLETSDSFVRIRRRIRMQGGAQAAMPIGADMYLPYEGAKPLLKTNPAELTLINVRPFLAERFGLVAQRATHRVSTRMLGELEAAAFNLDPREPMFAIEARVFDNADRPIYFQNIFAPCERCMLEF